MLFTSLRGRWCLRIGSIRNDWLIGLRYGVEICNWRVWVRFSPNGRKIRVI